MTFTTIIVIGFVIDIAFIITDYMKKYIPAVILKTLASLVFVYLGVRCGMTAGDCTYTRLIIAGLALGCAGDFFLNLRFISPKYDELCLKTGTAFFFAGHAVYIAATVTAGSSTYIAALPLSLVLCLTIISILLRKIEVKKELKLLGIIYFIIMISTFSFAAGLLIMTDDGELINKMTHPSVKIPKIYRVCVKGKIEQNDLIRWAKGIEIEKGKIAYAEAEVIDIEDGNTVLTVVLRQGMNRQIRKMADAIGHPVISLKRTHHGSIDLLGLQKGAFKYLKPSQVKELKNYIKKIEKEAQKRQSL